MERRSEHVAQTRERILEAALELFSKRGAQATTMNEVARADVSPTTVTNHFPTNESLIEAVIDRVVADIQVPDSTIFTGTQSLAGRLRVLTAARCSRSSSAPCTGSSCWAMNSWRCRPGTCRGRLLGLDSAVVRAGARRQR